MLVGHHNVGNLLTLSGAVLSYDSTSDTTSGIRFNTDGTVDKRENASYTQISAASDWIIPNSAAPSDYEVRVSGAPPGDAFTNSTGADGTWFTLDSAR